MVDALFNKNELLLDRVRSLTAHDLEDNRMILRLTSLEEPTLGCTAEGEEVTDAIGAVITTLYRAKRATFSATNSLVSLDLAAMQYGTRKEVAGASNKIKDSTYEILKIIVPKEMDPSIVTIKGGEETALGQKKIKDLIGDGVKILDDGTVIGPIKHVSDFTDFSKSESEGYFFPLQLNVKGSKVKVENKTRKTKKEVAYDPDWVLKVEPDSVYDVSVDDKLLFTLDFSKAYFLEQGKEAADMEGVVPLDAPYVQLSHKPSNPDAVRFIYSIDKNEVGMAYKAGPLVTETEFVINADGRIAVPTGLAGKVFVEYKYDSEAAVKVSNYASKFPEAVSLVIYCYFRDKCNENIVYSGKILCPKAKINPESMELSLTSTGKHPFEFTMMKDYCAEEDEDELFTILVSDETLK